MDIQTSPQTLNIACTFGKVSVTIGESFKWYGVDSGTYKVLGWSGMVGMYSPSGLGGTIGVMVENENGEKIEWCGDSVAHGVFMTKNPDYYRDQKNNQAAAQK